MKRLRAGNNGGSLAFPVKGNLDVVPISHEQAKKLVADGLIYSAGKGSFRPTIGTSRAKIKKILRGTP